MAHKTLVDGTAYAIKGGRTLIDGTGYSIKKGRTLVDGTWYDISFGPRTVAINNENVNNYFTVSTGDYPFIWDSLIKGWKAGNLGRDDTSSFIQFTAKYPMSVKFHVYLKTEEDYDEVSVTTRTTVIIRSASGEREYNKTVAISAGDMLRISYTKDSSASESNEMVYINNIEITGDF